MAEDARPGSHTAPMRALHWAAEPGPAGALGDPRGNRPATNTLMLDFCLHVGREHVSVV